MTDVVWREHRRQALRYPSDMADRALALRSPIHLPAKAKGRRRTMDVREMVNAGRCLAATGCT